MKQKKKLHYFYLVLGFLLVLVSCAKEAEIVEVEEPKVDDFILCEDEGFKSDSALDCGCDSEIGVTLQESHNLVGFLSKVDTTLVSKSFLYSYVIQYDDGEGGVSNYFICNDLCISSFKKIAVSSKIKIGFSGDIKRTCEGYLANVLNIDDNIIIIKKIMKK